jgi:lysophospholipase L1-like esterase
MLCRSFLTVLAAIALLLLEAPLHAQLMIMPLGDSVTYGYADENTGAVIPGGYRGYLYSNLEGEGYDVSYVGVNNENPSSNLTAAGQTEQSGFAGYTVNEITGNLDGSVQSANGFSNDGGYWLADSNDNLKQSAYANVILLMIGATDLANGTDPATVTSDLDTLLNKLIKLEPTATIFVGGALPAGESSGPNTTYDPNVPLYDTDVQNLIDQQFGGKNVEYVDQYDSFVNSDGTPKMGLIDSDDNTHPTAAGYQLLAANWNMAIEDVPEPSTNALLVAGVVTLFAFRRRFKRS